MRAVSIAVVTGVAVLGLLASAARSYERITVIEVNTHSASIRQHVYHVLYGVRLKGSLQAPVATSLTAFLTRGQRPPDEEEWVDAGRITTDWRDREIDRNLFHGVAQLLVGAPFKAENLPRVAELLPELPEMIRRDILEATHPGVGTMLMIRLGDMCSDPSEENVKRLREEWDWIKQNPGLFGGA